MSEQELAGYRRLRKPLDLYLLDCDLQGWNLLFKARYPSGKGEVCKTFMRRFDPDPRLHILQ
jgi:hypothetical protein